MSAAQHPLSSPLKTLALAALTVMIALLALGGVRASLAAQPKDYAKVVGPKECAECHKVTTKAWQATHHFATFTEMPRSKEGLEIADRMGIKRVKTDSLCMDCHFTSQEKAGQVESVAGISCESCHAPAGDWLKRHSEYSGKKKGQETPQEIAKRWVDSEAGGMIRPHMTYKLAKNCYSCHITPNEKLVNEGKHSPGSPFELVSWSQGEVRHKLWYNDGKANLEATPERKRMLFVVGAMVELEESLRAVGHATVKADYAVTMAKRAQIAAKRMAAIAQAANTPETAAILDVVKGVKLNLNNGAALNAAADKIGASARKFSDGYDGSTLAAVDGMIPGSDKYKGKVYP
ncbi:MAG: cytochrome c family protein [Rhodospirillum sp.]|nr:cytochrome c family protein [Rhodospirillum sp.]MCF8492068.1 cytochrome c family protein [Rhodospirillum sp.]MCF8502075.1 cytochrome c family protein [Rhodospirillum sp.]